MGLAFANRNPFLDVMWSALQAFNSALDGIVVQIGTVTSTYTYASTAYANPDAVTQLANGLSTTTYSYDNDGNLISSGNGTATTTYTYDYANRLISLFAGGATTTYGYYALGQRVLQTGTSTTTIYPFKWYSVASSTGTGAKYATTTSYMCNGDTLLATVDQQTASGVATGMANRLVRDHVANAVGVEEVDHVVDVPLRVCSQLVECGAIEQGTGNAGVNVFFDEHVTGGCDLALELRHLTFDGS